MRHGERAPAATGGRIYYGWWIVAACAGGFAVSAGIGNWAFGAFVKPLEAEFGWSRAEVSAASSLGMLSLAFASPLVGLWVDRWGARSAFIAGAVLAGAGLASLAYVEELWQFYALYSLATAFRALTTYIPLVAVVARWFPGRGMPVSLVMAGLGFGGVIFAPVATSLIEAGGWRIAYVYLGLIFSAYFLFIGIFVIRDRPRVAAASRIVQGATAAAGTHEPAHQWRLGEALRTPSFWLLNLGIALMWMAQIAFMVHAQPYMEWRGFPARSAALIVGLAALGASVARLGLGGVYDRLRRPRLFAFAVCLVGSLALAVLTASTLVPMLVLFLLLWAVGSGGSALLPPLLVSDTYGNRSIGSFLAFTEVTGTLGTVFGPVVGGVLFDASGSYVPAFVTYVAVFALAGLVFASFRPPTRPARPHVVAPAVLPVSVPVRPQESAPVSPPQSRPAMMGAGGAIAIGALLVALSLGLVAALHNGGRAGTGLVRRLLGLLGWCKHPSPPGRGRG